MLLCGLTMLVFATYWVPRRDPGRPGIRREVGRRRKEGEGLYPGLAAWGSEKVLHQFFGYTIMVQEEGLNGYVQGELRS